MYTFNTIEGTNTMNVLDRRILYFNDARIMYSVNEIKTLVSDKVTAPDSTVRITEDLSFRASDVVEHATSIWHNLLSSATDENL